MISPPVAHCRPLEVTQLLNGINALLQKSPNTHSVDVIGEVAGVKLQGKNCYFYLKDAESTLSCRLFNFAYRCPNGLPKEGEKIIVHGDMNIYKPYGSMSLIVERFTPAGKGDLLERLEKLRLKLQAEGLFSEERKRPRPFFPRVVGVVTSREGLAFGDIKKILRERAPHTKLWLVPARVQGVNAPASMISALHALEKMPEVDVIIIGRGGGSSEDLQAFNDEGLVRAVAACPRFIISAVGHDGDYSLCDYAADARASTPTNAAELATVSRRELLTEIGNLRKQSQSRFGSLLAQHRHELDSLTHRLRLQHPQTRVANAIMTLDDYRNRLDKVSAKLTERWRYSLESLRRAPGWAKFTQRILETRRQLNLLRDHLPAAMDDITEKYSTVIASFRDKLDALNPQRTLERGYVMLTDDQGQLITKVSQLHLQQSVSLSLGDGQAQATITSLHPNQPEKELS